MPLEPLEQKSLLTPLPLHAPRYKVPVQLEGQTAQASCPRALRALLALMDMGAVMGGAACHFGGPSALAELASATAVCLQHAAQKKQRPHYDLFHLINDAGHCENIFYALRTNLGWGVSFDELKLFRSILSPLTGHGESGLFAQGVYLSNGPLGSALPQAEGLAMADKLQGMDRTTICFVSDGACMEGEAREALASTPGLAARNKLNPFLLILSDNQTKLSGPISEAFSMQPSFQALSELGWRVEPFDAPHNLQACVDVLQGLLSSLDAARPCVLWAKTVKGYGVRAASESPSGGHGFALKKPEQLGEFLREIYQGEPVPDEFLKWRGELVAQSQSKKSASAAPPLAAPRAKKDGELSPDPARGNLPPPWGPPLAAAEAEKIQKGVSRALICAAKRWPVVSVSSDLQGSTGVAAFAKEFPARAFDVGVAEANMLSVGAGLSKQGFVPVVDTFAQFGVTKGALPLTMANLSQAPVIAVFSHVGFQDAADGASHQALSYYAAVSAIPNVQVFSLTCSSEAEALLGQAIDEFAAARQAHKTPSSYVFFLGREVFAPFYVENPSYKLGQSQVVWPAFAEGAKTLESVTERGGMRRLRKQVLQGVGFSSTSRDWSARIPIRFAKGRSLSEVFEAYASRLLSSKTRKNFYLCTLAAAGSMLPEALKAAQILRQQGHGCIVLNPSCINRPDVKTFARVLEKTSFNLLTIEEHQLTAGMGAMLVHALLQAGVTVRARSLGVKGGFGQSAYKAQDLYVHHGLDADSIVQKIKEWLL